MKIALSLFGVLEENGNSSKTSASSLLMQTALGTLPVGKDTTVGVLILRMITIRTLCSLIDCSHAECQVLSQHANANAG